MNDKISELVVTIDSIAQKEFTNDVQVVGLGESPSSEEDMKKVVKMAKEKMGMKLKKTDVKSIHRLGKMSPHKAMPRDLVIRFKDQTTRDEFHNNRKKMATSKLSQQNIYINDRLTTLRKGLFFEARKLYKARKLFATWTQKGNVLVRVKENDAVIQINNYDDLQRLRDTKLRRYDTSEQNSSLHSSHTDEPDVTSHLSDYDFYVESDY